MKKYNQIYKIVSIGYFTLHCLLLAFIVAVGFLPFCEGETIYQSYGAWQTVLFILLPLLLAGVAAFFAIKKPLLSIVAAVLTFASFIMLFLPVATEAMVVGLMSMYNMPMSVYQTGYTLMSYASYEFYIDIIFVIYSIVTVIIRAVSKRIKKEEGRIIIDL